MDDRAGCCGRAAIRLGYGGGVFLQGRLHRDLKGRFIALEMAILAGDDQPDTWAKYEVERLRIEQDEPPIYRALDLLCHNELLVAEGHKRTGDAAAHFADVGKVQRFTRHIVHWPDLAA